VALLDRRAPSPAVAAIGYPNRVNHHGVVSNKRAGSQAETTVVGYPPVTWSVCLPAHCAVLLFATGGAGLAS
jgi:hypothetical protein